MCSLLEIHIFLRESELFSWEETTTIFVYSVLIKVVWLYEKYFEFVFRICTLFSVELKEQFSQGG